MAKKHHGPPHEEHPDETWLVPYSDLLTLLLALFIVLFATAKVDNEKFAQVANAMHNALGAGIGGALGGAIGSGQTVLSGGVGITSGPASTPTTLMNPAELEGAQLEKAKSEIEAFIKQTEANAQGGQDGQGGIDHLELETIMTDQGLLVRIRDSALFASGSAQISPAGVKFAQMVSEVIGTLPQNILISGHTDNLPINTVQYPSNWELSSARAINLMKYLLTMNHSLQPARLSAIGCGEYRPVASNGTPEGRSKNRRVEILIQKMYSDSGEKAKDSIINPTVGKAEAPKSTN